jgi:5-methyltetrahydrofolate--homocysteine methyltransferase
MKRGIVERLGTDTLLLDGGMGSSLIARGLASGGSTALCNLERPDLVSSIHAGFLAAGSEVIQTNTFGGNLIALESHGLAAKAEEINLAGARVALDAAGGASSDALVAGSIGPSGTFLPPVGNADPDKLTEVFSAQAADLEAGGVDYLSIETMTDIDEALCALRGSLSSTRLAVTVCLTFEKKRRGFFTIMGNRLEEAPRILADAGAAAVGANCSMDSGAMGEACVLLLEASPVPVVIKPNAGLPEIDEGRPVYLQDPSVFAEDLSRMARLGAAAVGGCCGADSIFIASLRQALASDPANCERQ